MLFTDPAFFVFLAVMLIGDRLMPARRRNAFLLLGSYAFYGLWDWRFLPLLILCATADFLAGRMLARCAGRAGRAAIVAATLSFNLLVLWFFKYRSFLLPLGISFYTFQSMSYTLDVYRGDYRPTRSWVDYSLFVSFFPHLLVGPVQRAASLLAQFERPRRPSREQLLEGATLMLIGYVKKAVLADSIASIVDDTFSRYASLPSSQLLVGLVLFSLQVYWDFSGYSDIARGAAKWFGIDMVINFEQPYLSRDIREFWRRWHISISTWFRDYVYIPLGGSRRGEARTLFNIMVTMLLCGLWHGPGWNFVACCGLHGLYLAIYRLTHRSGGQARVLQAAGLPASAARCALTYALVLIAWIPFRAPDLRAACGYFVRLVCWTGPVRLEQIAILSFMFAIYLAIDLPMYLSGSHTFLLRAPAWLYRTVAVAGAAAVAVALAAHQGAYRPFIYFQF